MNKLLTLRTSRRLAFARLLALAILAAIAVAGATLATLHEQRVSSLEAAWRADEMPPVGAFGSTSSLAVLPLVNWHVGRPDLRGEAGVSYLVRTDRHTILFDVAHNARHENPSPLEHNLATLGVHLDSIDMVFISHRHFDHVGGTQWARRDTFSTGNLQRPLPGVAIRTPVPMRYPGSVPVHTPTAQALGEGIATTGTIPRQLFMGRIDEQALVINVEGKGLVLIVGCGHQTLSKLLARVRASFSEPLYGVIGDLHYPVPDGRMSLLGMNAQRIFASGHAPWRPLSETDVARDIALLAQHPIGVVAIGGHDSSDHAIQRFRSAFGNRHRDVRVGEWIVVAGDTSARR